MHREIYERPLQFRKINSHIPQTPNLEQIKRIKMNRKKSKDQEDHIKIMTPRPTKNLLGMNSETKKSFRNLSLVIDCLSEPLQNEVQKTVDKNKECKTFSGKVGQNSCSFYEKQNNGFLKNSEIKKKLQSHHILLKEGKFNKNRNPLLDEVRRAESHFQSSPHPLSTNLFALTSNSKQKQHFKKISQDTKTPLNNNLQGFGHMTDFDSVNCPNLYKILALASLKQTIDNFSGRLLTTQKEVTNHHNIMEQTFESEIQLLKDFFDHIAKNLITLKEKTLSQMCQRAEQIQKEHQEELLKISAMRTSIFRYQADIDAHYDEIVSELDLDCFNDVTNKYDKKIQYFQGKVKEILTKRSSHAFITIGIRKSIEKIISIECQKYQEKKSEKEVNIMKSNQVFGMDQMTERKSGLRISEE